MAKAKKRRSVFAKVVDTKKQHPRFKILKNRRTLRPARWMLNEIYKTYEDIDGNFLEQFQSNGFDARYFELYLHAYFSRTGFQIDRPKPAPDFIVERDSIKVAVEATTVNPSTTGAVAKHGKKIKEMSQDEYLEYQHQELAIRFGGPLVTKLKKKYWNKRQCKNLPLVLAIEAFYDEESLAFTDLALSRYVFGIDQTGKWSKAGKLKIKSKKVTKHKLGSKVIPSGFFKLPDSEHISAIMFTNSGTNAKFLRMGFQHGIDNDRIVLVRQGKSYDFNPDAIDPCHFSYNLDCPPLVESWGQGLVVLHNPNCIHPIPRGYFAGAVDHYMDSNRMASELTGWHPMSSHTFIFDLNEAKAKVSKLPIRTPSIAVASIPKREFQAIIGINHDNNPILEESGWFTDETTSFLSVLFRDKVDNDWGMAILARDSLSRFRAIETKSSLSSREEARDEMYRAMVKYLASPKRIFEQGDEFDGRA